MLIDGRVTPHVEEAQLIGLSIASTASSVVVLNMPTIHASRIDVFVKSVGNDVDVDLLLYGASKNILLTETLGIVTTAAGTGAFVYGPDKREPVGQVASLQLTNNNAPGTGAATVVTVFMSARPL
jgi:hypothetical protein